MSDAARLDPHLGYPVGPSTPGKRGNDPLSVDAAKLAGAREVLNSIVEAERRRRRLSRHRRFAQARAPRLIAHERAIASAGLITLAHAFDMGRFEALGLFAECAAAVWAAIGTGESINADLRKADILGGAAAVTAEALAP